MILKQENLKLGLVLGLLGPLIVLVVFYLIKFSGVSFGVFLDEFFNNNELITSNGTLSLLANVVLFTLYVNTHRDSTAKGIFIIPLHIGIAILVLKLVNF